MSTKYRIQGEIKNWNSDRGFGFVRADDGNEYFLHVLDTDGFESAPQRGDRLEFEVGQGRDGRVRALRAEPI